MTAATMSFAPDDEVFGADLAARVAAVGAALRAAAPLGVAFSGGVDSAVLLALAVRALGADQVIAVLGISPSLASAERLEAHRVAEFIGARVVEVETHEGDKAAYRANDVDRCFHCKDELFTRITDEVASRYGLRASAYGENADDAERPDRPGSRAATQHRVLRPLATAGLDKAAVRDVARALELPCADKPAAPCLASRIPHHQEVTPEKLAQVDAAESALWKLGFSDVRVRHHGDIARIEVPADELVRAAELHAEVAAAGRAAGFPHVALDLGGMQSGRFTLDLLAVNGRETA